VEGSWEFHWHFDRVYSFPAKPHETDFLSARAPSSNGCTEPRFKQERMNKLQSSCPVVGHERQKTVQNWCKTLGFKGFNAVPVWILGKKLPGVAATWAITTP
jgi:hypothetical protein